jgi:hypothetical protein
MQGLMIDRHCVSQWQLSDEEQQDDANEAVEAQWQLSDEEEQQEDAHEVASVASSSDSSDLEGELLPAEMTPSQLMAAAQDEQMVRHGRLQNLIHASGGLSAIRPDVSIGRKEVNEWSDFMEQGLASVEEAIASLSLKASLR